MAVTSLGCVGSASNTTYVGECLFARCFEGDSDVTDVAKLRCVKMQTVSKVVLVQQQVHRPPDFAAPAYNMSDSSTGKAEKLLRSVKVVSARRLPHQHP